MTYLIDIELDEFQPWPGMSCYLYGEAQISFKWEPQDRDTGYRGGPYDLELQHLRVNADKAGDMPHGIEATDPLFKAVETAIVKDDWIIGRCVEHYERRDDAF